MDSEELKEYLDILTLPKYKQRKMVALYSYNEDSHHVILTWITPEKATDLINQGIHKAAEESDVDMIIDAMHLTVIGVTNGELGQVICLPTKYDLDQECMNRVISFHLRDWRFGSDALIQYTCFNETGDELITESISGDEAWSRLCFSVNDPYAELLGFPDSVFGVKYKDGSREEFWDCDEMTYSEYQEANK